MKYGYFDDANKEYVITKPDTPRPWSNYLGSREYGAIITNNAGGYSFYKSAVQGRFMRMRFNSVPLDQPGRYLYVRDRESSDFWSTSWMPAGKPLSEYTSECRHGAGYTKISSVYDNIATETTYFVPSGQTYECWLVKVANHDRSMRKLRLFTYIEYACNWSMFDDQNNLQYSQYIAKMDFVDGIIDHGSNVMMPAMPDRFEEKDQKRHTFLGVAGAQVTGYDTDREVFIGPYNNYSNPQVLQAGECTNSLAVGDNPCGVLQIDIDLEPDVSTEFVVIMGIGEAATVGRQVLARYENPENVRTDFNAVREHWHQRIGAMEVHTPDAAFNSMMNMWNPFNCLITFNWSRAASLIYAGERDGLGYRDTVQDTLGACHLIPDETKERLELMITGQVSTGGAMPVVKQFSHRPGQEKAPDETEYRSDDCLWLFNAIQTYVKETGEVSFYDKVLPYADQGADTVLGHLKRAIQFNIERSGAHGLPCGLRADWNDCLQLGHDGESVFVAFQLRFALKTYIEVSELLKKPQEVDWAQPLLQQLDDTIETHCWDGEWFNRAFRYDGLVFGSKESEEGSIFLNSQTWAIISGHATDEQAKGIMEVVKDRLATEYGIAICDPPFEKMDFNIVRAILMNKGMKENGGIFCHTQGWAVMCEAMLGNGNQAFDYYRKFMPAAYNNRAEIRQIEPYVYCQSTHSTYSPRYGASRIPWLSGTASWANYSAVHYIMGIQPDYAGLRIDPCVPAEWREFSVRRNFRGKILNIHFINKNGSQKGVSKIVMNGSEIDGNLIPVEIMKEENEVAVYME